MRGNVTQKIDRRLVQTCRLFYEQRLSKSEIARRQQLSVTHVNRLLQEGQRLGCVEIRVVGPRLKSLELELLSKYKLKEVRIVASANDHSATRVELGKQGAIFFEEIVAPDFRIGVSSGRTMFEVVSHVTERSRNISVFPLNVIHESETRMTAVSANTSATILWFRSRPAAIAHHVELFLPESARELPRSFVRQMHDDPSVRTVGEAIDDLDAYFLGAGEAGLQSRFSLLRGHGLADSRVVGDVAFNALNPEGEFVASGAEDLIFHVGLTQLKRAAKSRDKSVVLVAGGENKVEVIRAAIRAQLCNVLITDSDAAEHLVKGDEPSKAESEA